MTLYSVSASGVVVDGPNVLIQLFGSGLLGRARIHSWDLSFAGVVAGNVMDISLEKATDSFGAWRYKAPAVLDGSNKFIQGPYVADRFAVVPSSLGTVDSLQAVDSAYLRKQYQRGREPVVAASESLYVKCTPSELFTPVPWRMNVFYSM